MFFHRKKNQSAQRFLVKRRDFRFSFTRVGHLEYFNHVALMALFGMLWVWHLDAVTLTPPMDNIEQWVWSHALQWGYHKHPPLPTWLLYVPQMLTGPTAWTTQVLGALCTLISIGIFANLIRQIWGKPVASVALLAALCITFYNGRLNHYNHNILLLLFVALSAQCWWMILQNGQRRWWIGLGLCAGLGMLSKYQYLIMVLPSAYFVWQIKPWRKPKQLQGLMWAVGTAAIVFFPHLLWLIQQDLASSPIRYAFNTSFPEHQLQSSPITNRIRSVVWLLDLFFNRCLPALVFLWLLRAFCFNKAAPAPEPSHLVKDTQVSGIHFLMVWGLMPPLTMTLLGLTLGMDLQMHWGTAFAVWLIPPFMVVIKVHQLQKSRRLQKVAWGGVLIIQAGLMIHYNQTPTSIFKRTFDSAALARELTESTRQANIGLITIISGAATTGGAIALAMPDHPKILIDGDLKISPWIQKGELQAPGVIQLWAPQTGPAHQTRLPSGWGWSHY